MSKTLKTLRETVPFEVFSDTEAALAIGGSSDRQYGIIKRAIAAGDITQIRRGLYAFARSFQRTAPNLNELANKIYAPSYVSLESALAHHGAIPEATYTTTSVSIKRSRTVETPFGTFAYTGVTEFNMVGVERHGDGGALFLMASIEKALVDYVHVRGLAWRGAAPLTDSLRFDEAILANLSGDELLEAGNSYRSRKISAFVKGLRRDLGQ